jgi:mannose-6-phosphate isomerase-like protein (cupin superfamily)
MTTHTETLQQAMAKFDAAEYHPEEEVWRVLEGEVQISLEGSPSVVRPGQAVVVLGGERHEARALSAARVIVANDPVRTMVGGLDTSAG